MKVLSTIFSLLLLQTSLNAIVLVSGDNEIVVSRRNLMFSETMKNMIESQAQVNNLDSNDENLRLELPVTFSVEALHFIFNMLCDSSAVADTPVWEYISSYLQIEQDNVHDFFANLPRIIEVDTACSWLDLDLYSFFKTHWSDALLVYLDRTLAPEEGKFWFEFATILEIEKCKHSSIINNNLKAFIESFKLSCVKHSPKYVSENWSRLIESYEKKELFEVRENVFSLPTSPNQHLSPTTSILPMIMFQPPQLQQTNNQHIVASQQSLDNLD